MVKALVGVTKLAVAAAVIWFAVVTSVDLLERTGWPGGEVPPEMVAVLAAGWSFLMLWSYATARKSGRRRGRRRAARRRR